MVTDPHTILSSPLLNLKNQNPKSALLGSLLGSFWEPYCRGGVSRERYPKVRIRASRTWNGCFGSFFAIRNFSMGGNHFFSRYLTWRTPPIISKELIWGSQRLFIVSTSYHSEKIRKYIYISKYISNLFRIYFSDSELCDTLRTFDSHFLSKL